MKPYIIFDMDGVIIDSESWYMNQLRNFFVSRGYVIPEKKMEEILGLNTKDIFDILKEYINYQGNIQYLFEKYLQELKFPNYQQIVFPNVQQCIENIFQKNIDIIIASSSPRKIIKQVLTDLNLDKYILFYMGKEDVKKTKPSPEVYQIIVRQQKYQKPLFVVEDSTFGIQAAKMAGLEVVAYYSGKFQNNQSQSDIIITNHMQLLKLL